MTDQELLDDVKAKQKALIAALNAAIEVGLSVCCTVQSEDTFEQYDHLTNRQREIVRERTVTATRAYK